MIEVGNEEGINKESQAEEIIKTEKNPLIELGNLNAYWNHKDLKQPTLTNINF